MMLTPFSFDVLVSQHKGAHQWVASLLTNENFTCEVKGDTLAISGRAETPYAGEYYEKPIVAGNAKPEDVKGKVVLGNLPLKLAALANEVIAIEFDGAPPRGAEYGVKEMEAAGARLAKYVVENV